MSAKAKASGTLHHLPTEIVPVGVVRRESGPETGDPPKTVWIHVFPEFEAALDGIDVLEHLTILYWMHRLRPQDRRRLRVHPRGDRSRAKQGVFALAQPMRPNPIGVTTVRLIRREGLELCVEGLDALDGAPVIDIKYGRTE